jgi:hypothetical protein
MDFTRLAAAVTALLAAQPAAPAVQPLWEAITARFQDRPAAEAAAADFQRNASDPDNQQAFEVQLRQLLKEEPGLASQLAALFAAVSPSAPPPAGPSIFIGGGVGGHVVVGSGNTVSSSVHTERHGGIDVNAGQDVNVGGDVVGHDKTES